MSILLKNLFTLVKKMPHKRIRIPMTVLLIIPGFAVAAIYGCLPWFFMGIWMVLAAYKAFFAKGFVHRNMKNKIFEFASTFSKILLFISPAAGRLAEIPLSLAAAAQLCQCVHLALSKSDESILYFVLGLLFTAGVLAISIVLDAMIGISLSAIAIVATLSIFISKWNRLFSRFLMEFHV